MIEIPTHIKIIYIMVLEMGYSAYDVTMEKNIVYLLAYNLTGCKREACHKAQDTLNFIRDYMIVGESDGINSNRYPGDISRGIREKLQNRNY